MLKEGDITRLLIEEFKEMKKCYENDTTGLDLNYHTELLYLCDFTPYVVKQLDGNNRSELEKIFAFIEKLLIEGDKMVRIVVIDNVLEALYFDYDFEKYEGKIYSLCGKRTRKAFDDIDAAHQAVS